MIRIFYIQGKIPVHDAAEVLDIISCYSKISHGAYSIEQYNNEFGYHFYHITHNTYMQAHTHKQKFAHSFTFVAIYLSIVNTTPYWRSDHVEGHFTITSNYD